MHGTKRDQLFKFYLWPATQGLSYIGKEEVESATYGLGAGRPHSPVQHSSF